MQLHKLISPAIKKRLKLALNNAGVGRSAKLLKGLQAVCVASSVHTLKVLRYKRSGQGSCA